MLTAHERDVSYPVLLQDQDRTISFFVHAANRGSDGDNAASALLVLHLFFSVTLCWRDPQIVLHQDVQPTKSFWVHVRLARSSFDVF
jgi:hypothetical protein